MLLRKLVSFRLVPSNRAASCGGGCGRFGSCTAPCKQHSENLGSLIVLDLCVRSANQNAAPQNLHVQLGGPKSAASFTFDMGDARHNRHVHPDAGKCT